MKHATFALFYLLLLLINTAYSYPMDGYPATGIRRLYRLDLIQNKKLKGTLPAPGGRLTASHIALHLLPSATVTNLSSFTPDSLLQTKLVKLFKRKDPNYSVAVLDISKKSNLRFATYNPDKQGVPGSVGKIAIAAGLFTELAHRYPDSIDKRTDLLKTRVVKAGQWAMPNHHEIPVFNLETKAFSARAVKPSDEFTLYEWTDHMLSASSNAAASVLWKEVVLMHVFGEAYPPDEAQERDYFAKTSKKELGAIAFSVVNDPLRAIGITDEAWRLGSLFTATGKRLLPAPGGSHATSMGLLSFLYMLEQGKVVDTWSSIEIKKLLYMTAKRIRYASSSALDSAALYFKSGSQYKCKKEEGFVCKKYHGNVENHLNSVAIVEHPDGTTYLVALMSNVLRKNSAYDHQVIATELDALLRQRDQ